MDVAGDTSAMRYYVSPTGDDNWSGKLDSPNNDRNDGPFATIDQARNAIRKLKYSGRFNRPIEVCVRGGKYYLDHPIRLNAADSGTEQNSITYKAFPGEKSVLCGSRVIRNWRPYKDQIFCAQLPEVTCQQWRFRQLFCDGRRMVRSRYPKSDKNDPLYGGWAFVEEILPELDEGFEYVKTQIGPKFDFAIDPDRQGIEQEWFGAGAAEVHWDEIQTTTYWQKQGYKHYHGWAWYRVNFAVPVGYDTKELLWLCFGAVDKEAIIYIDGVKVFEHTMASTGLDESGICRLPFKFEVTDSLQVGKQHQMTVLVKSEIGAGGIWQNVWLVNSNTDFEPSIFSDSIENPRVFKYSKDLAQPNWDKPEQGEVFIFPGLCWINDIIPIKRIDTNSQTLSLERPVHPSAGGLAMATAIRKGNRFFVENILEELTEPGQWCLDKETGTLYFWPPDGNIHDCVITAPVTERLIELRGSSHEPVSNITIQGLTFTQTLSGFPNRQVYYKTPNSGQTLYMENSQRCCITDNVFNSVGGDAIRLQNDNNENHITGNKISDAGGYGVFVASYQEGLCPHNPPGSGDIPSPASWVRFPQNSQASAQMLPVSAGHLISNNEIDHVGLIEKHACGIAFFGVNAYGCCVSHNQITRTTRFGIGLMSGIGGVTVEYNKLEDISLETADTGAICSNRWYTYEHDPKTTQGCVVRFNLIRNVVGCAAYGKKAEPGGLDKADGRIWTNYYSWAVYFDNGPMDVQVYGNICDGNALGGIMISHYGRNVTVENNMFLNSSQSQAYFLLGGEMSGIEMRRNIFCYSSADADFARITAMGTIDLSTVMSHWDGNLYFNQSGNEITFSGVPGEAVERTSGQSNQPVELTFEKWKELGYDKNTIIADPGFKGSLENGDYGLSDDSPAFKLGFKPIDIKKIGLRGK